MPLRILVVTSCSGSKAFSIPNQLTLTDFQTGGQHLSERTKELERYSLPAAQMYTGRQHPLILRALQKLIDRGFPHQVSLVIVSAGYGLLQANDPIVPYDVTFTSPELSGKKGLSWARHQQLTPDLQREIDQNDLVIFLLGDDYLSALDLPLRTKPEQTLVFMATEKRCEALHRHQAKVGCTGLNNAHAKQFSYGLTGLRGLLFEHLAAEWLSDAQAVNSWYESPQEALNRFMAQSVTE